MLRNDEAFNETLNQNTIAVFKLAYFIHHFIEMFAAASPDIYYFCDHKGLKIRQNVDNGIANYKSLRQAGCT